MSESRCINCMKKMEAGITCPHCGALQQADPNYPYAMRPNTILHGKYLIGRVLGQGGFGITYVGFDLALEMKVAVKEYFPQGFAGRSGNGTNQIVWNISQMETGQAEKGVKAFLKEARQMAKLDSLPAIVRVRDTFPDNGTAYIVMDFVEGETLKRRLMRSGPMSFEGCVQFLDPLLDSLENMHKQNLIHRDISPDNIMVRPDKSPCLLDLGAAKDLAGNGSLSSQLVMKRGFSPLEQCTSGGNIGPWTDVYALTATIYYSIMGKLVPNVMDRAYSENYGGGTAGLDFITVSGQVLPSAVCSVLTAGLALRPEDRIQTIGELRTALKKACRGIPYSGSNSGGGGGGSFGGTNGSGGSGSGSGTNGGGTGGGGDNTGGSSNGTGGNDSFGSGGGNNCGSDGTGGSGGTNGGGKSKKKIGLIAVAAVAVIVVIGIAAAVGGDSGSGTTVSNTEEGEDETIASDAEGGGDIIIVDASGNVMCDISRYNEDDDIYYVYGSSYKAEDIYTITFVDEVEDNSTAWDVSDAGDGSVMAWVETNGSGYDLYIGGDGGVDLPRGSRVIGFFSGFINVEEIDFNSCVYTGDVTNMNLMFWHCSSLVSLDLSGFDTSNVTSMGSMFSGCSSLVYISGFSFWDTSAVTVMSGMFSGCSSLNSLDLSSFDTSNVTDMSYMFWTCSSLVSLDLSGFDTTNVTYMTDMFDGCSISAEEAGLN